MVQHLVEDMTSTSLTMQTVSLVHTQTLAGITLFQVEYKAGQLSWLGLTHSHLMRWRCFILAESEENHQTQSSIHNIFAQHIETHLFCTTSTCYIIFTRSLHEKKNRTYWNRMYDHAANVRNILCATMLPHNKLSCVIASVWPGLNAISKEYM